MMRCERVMRCCDDAMTRHLLPCCLFLLLAALSLQLVASALLLAPCFYHCLSPAVTVTITTSVSCCLALFHHLPSSIFHFRRAPSLRLPLSSTPCTASSCSVPVHINTVEWQLRSSSATCLSCQDLPRS